MISCSNCGDNLWKQRSFLNMGISECSLTCTLSKNKIWLVNMISKQTFQTCKYWHASKISFQEVDTRERNVRSGSEKKKRRISYWALKFQLIFVFFSLWLWTTSATTTENSTAVGGNYTDQKITWSLASKILLIAYSNAILMPP